MTAFVQRSPSARRHRAFHHQELANAPSAGRPSAWSIRTSLALLAVACILPGALMSTYFIVSDYRQQKARATQEAVAIARAATANLDRDIASIEAGLHVLGTSSALDNDDLAAFYLQARDALPFQNINNYVLIDPSGRQKLNTLRPRDVALPSPGGPPELGRIFDTGRTVLTDLFTGPVSGKPTLAIGVPVLREGKIAYSLNAGLSPERVAALLKAQHLPPQWIGAVLDSQGTVIARTHDMARFTGQKAVPDLVRMARQRREGVLETVSLEGTPVITAFSRSSLSAWTVAVGVPKAGLEAGLKQSLAVLLVVNTLISAAGMWLAWRLALSRVVHPAEHLLERMGRMSRGLDPGEPPPAVASREFMALDRGFADMAERLKQHDEARRAKIAAEAANQAKTDFLSRMSHELRTPLNAVLGFAQVLKMNSADPLSNRQLTMVNQIESSGLHLLEMIADVLDVSRIENDAIEVFIDDLDARAITRDCQQMMGEQARAAGIHLEIIIQDDVSRVRADRTRLKQVLINLLSNAIKYNRPGGRVTLLLQELDGQTTFRVRDTGMGMTQEQARHLFEPFNRLGRERTSTPGTGIGLVICKRLLEMMGSRLSVRTIESEGSEFMFSLPASVQAGMRPVTASAPAPATSSKSAVYGARRVLCVEDNQVNRDIMSAMLDLRPQIELVFEHSAKSAMRRIEQESFDLILLDMELPDGHGLDLLAWIQQDGQRDHPPLVIVSADVSQDTIARAERGGASQYLQKPLDLKRTLAMLDSLLAGESMSRQPSSIKP